MSDRFTVVIADFLDETSIESAVLGDIAQLVMAGATEESQLSASLPQALYAEIFPSLQRNLASGANGTVNVALIEPGTMFGPRQRQSLRCRSSTLRRAHENSPEMSSRMVLG